MMYLPVEADQIGLSRLKKRILHESAGRIKCDPACLYPSHLIRHF